MISVPSEVKRHWFGVNNYINTGVDDPLNGAPDQIQNVICLNRVYLSYKMGYGLMSEWGPSGKYHTICDVIYLKASKS